MPFTVTQLSYDLHQKRVFATLSDEKFNSANANFVLHVPEDTPERLLRQKIEEQLRLILKEAANFSSEQPKGVPLGGAPVGSRPFGD